MEDVKKSPRFDRQSSVLKYTGRSLIPDYIMGSSKDYSRSGWYGLYLITMHIFINKFKN